MIPYMILNKRFTSIMYAYSFYLQFQSPHLMVELSIIGGNDFTSQYVSTGLNRQIDIRGRFGVETLAEWVNRYKGIENHPMLYNEMVKLSLAYSVINSLQLYQISLAHLHFMTECLWSKLVNPNIDEAIGLYTVCSHLLSIFPYLVFLNHKKTECDS